MGGMTPEPGKRGVGLDPRDPSGLSAPYKERCPNCGGEGVVAIPYREYDPRRSAGCSRCRGTGWVPACVMEPRA